MVHLCSLLHKLSLIIRYIGDIPWIDTVLVAFSHHPQATLVVAAKDS